MPQFRSAAWMKGLLLLTLMVGGQAGAEVETVTYLHTDHLGSPIMGRDASGNAVFREEYGPWGQQLNAATPSDDVTYTGHANEGDIGLTYMKARWYDPAVGRFLSPDPVTFDGGGAGYLKRYSYVHNSPYGNVDPDGEFVFAGIGVAMVVAGAMVSGYELGSNIRQVQDGHKTLSQGATDAAIGMAAGFVLKGAGKVALNTGKRISNSGLKSLKDQAADLVKKNDNRNRVTLRSSSQKMEVDLAGKDHGGVPTPHTKVSPRNMQAPKQPAYNTKNSPVRSST